MSLIQSLLMGYRVKMSCFTYAIRIQALLHKILLIFALIERLIELVAVLKESLSIASNINRPDKYSVLILFVAICFYLAIFLVFLAIRFFCFVTFIRKKFNSVEVSASCVASSSF
ncbi:hypothetical protein EDC96DRAFT_346831 [Choanephora cucurbitarum]|nr:hypothetical protein EDC96DRAFT_346831 [Choanephora cucurbitarum]